MFILQLLLQIPKGVPQPDGNDSIMLNSPFDYILYVVLPILILIGTYFWWRRKKKREENLKD